MLKSFINATLRAGLLSIVLLWSVAAVAAETANRADFYAENIAALHAAAEKGDAKAQNDLGNWYSWGTYWGVQNNYQKSVNWYRKAAEQGLAEAQYNLAGMYLEGQGVLKNNQEAIKWYRKAAEQGFIGAQFAVGAMYEDGQGVQQNYEEAAKWYRKVAEHKNTDAMNYGEIYTINSQYKLGNYVFKWIRISTKFSGIR
jgi:TPR repeat protein